MRIGATALIIVLFLLVGVALPTASALDDPIKGPWCETKAKGKPEKRASGPGSLPVFLVKVYRKYISPIDGSDCPMYPSCSRYSIECFERHGLFMGWIMTWDRLYRCARDEMKLSPWLLTNRESKSKCYDPVESNDFWLSHEE